MLQQNEDLANITDSHRDLKRHKFYDQHVKFPPVISHLLPPQAERWWEHISTVPVPPPSPPVAAGSSPHASLHAPRPTENDNDVHMEDGALSEEKDELDNDSDKQQLVLPVQPKVSDCRFIF